MSIAPVFTFTEIMNDMNTIHNIGHEFTGIVDFTEVDDDEEEEREEETSLEVDNNLKSLANVKDDYLHSMFTHENYHHFNISTIENVFAEQPLYLRRVLMLHFIIMYHSYSHLEFYLELLHQK